MLDLRQRAQLHSALADESRLAIVDDLAVSDRSPKELSERFGVAPNLLAHHLEVLEAAGLLERFVSAGDRRRRYVRLRPEPIAELGVATANSVDRVVFVCHHNSARSQLAAALWERHTGSSAESAGTDPADAVHPGAIEAARRSGLDLGDTRPKHLDTIDGRDAVHLITVCDRAHESLDQPVATAERSWHWSVPSPTDLGGDRAAFDRVVAELDDRIRSFVTAATAITTSSTTSTRTRS